VLPTPVLDDNDDSLDSVLLDVDVRLERLELDSLDSSSSAIALAGPRDASSAAALAAIPAWIASRRFGMRRCFLRFAITSSRTTTNSRARSAILG
jgi:hypothetical protein